MKRLFKVLILIVLLGILFFVYNRYRILTSLVSDRHIAVGFWTQGFYDRATNTLHPEALQKIESAIDWKFRIAHFYRGWEALPDPELVSQFDTIESNGWTPMLSTNPYFFDGCTLQPSLYKAIANGHCDEFLHDAGRNLAKVKKPFYFVFAWEMNNPAIGWNVHATGSTGSDFKAAWRHMHDVFEAEGVTNAIWTFVPDVQEGANISYAEIYPGDDVVDWAGLDGYNWGTTQSWSSWKSFSDVFTPSYNSLVDVVPNKPFLLSETNSASDGGDKALWYRSMLEKELPEQFPKIKAVIFYNEDRTASEHVNWLIDVTPDTLKAFREGIHKVYYK